jgi:uncharacterized protein
VDIPARLRQRHPEEMTIVLQHQFWDLESTEAQFSVTLSFDRMHEKLTVPFAAITAFVDPSVQFGLQFPHVAANVASLKAAAPAKLPEPSAKPPTAKPVDPKASETETTADSSSRVVTLDAFRKK